MLEKDSTKEENIADIPQKRKRRGLAETISRLRSEPEIGSQSKKGKHGKSTLATLGDFTTTPRTIIISLFAIVIGAVGAFIALILLRLIGLFTNLLFFQRWNFALVSPAGNKLGVFEIFVPVIGALIIGLMARYGSERIRGHGIPEAIESILINGSKIEPKVAILKPISSAISIGSGGPFGAEGPIIMTGGAFGSMIAQFFHFTSAERKTLLVAGAAAGMSATFAAPVASVLLAVELLLFEWKPRSLIPVALASATAAVLRRYIIGVRTTLPYAAASGVYRPGSYTGLCAGWHTRGRTFRLAHDHGLRLRRCFPPAAHSLDVVAGYWRSGDRYRRLDFPAGAWRWLRYHRLDAQRHSDDASDRWCANCQIYYLVCLTGVRHIGWRSGASLDDGWRTGWNIRPVLTLRRHWLLAFD